MMGSHLVIRLWCAAKLHDVADGDITQFWRWEVIAKIADMESVRTDLAQMGVPAEHLPSLQELTEHAMRQVVGAGLIELLPTEQVVIHNWEDYQTPSTKAAQKRKRRQRAKQRVSSLEQADLPYMGAGNLEGSDPGKIAVWWMNAIGMKDRNDMVEWINELEKLYRSGVEWEEQLRMVRFIVGDKGDGRWSGWSAVIQSPAKLRALSKDKRPYWEVVQAQMRTNSGGRSLHLRPSENGVSLDKCILDTEKLSMEDER